MVLLSKTKQTKVEAKEHLRLSYPQILQPKKTQRAIWPLPISNREMTLVKMARKAIKHLQRVSKEISNQNKLLPVKP